MGKQFLDLLKDAPPIRYVYALYTFSIGFFFICVLTFDKHRTHDNVVQRISTGISTDISTGSRGYAPEVVNRTGTVGRQLVQELYSGDDPMGHKPSAPADFSYPHTNLNEEVVDHALALLVASYGAQQVNFVLEVGSFKGGSASLIVERLKSAGLVSCSVICVVTNNSKVCNTSSTLDFPQEWFYNTNKFSTCKFIVEFKHSVSCR